MRKYYKRLFCQVVLVIVAVAFISVVVCLTIFLNPFFEQNPCVENFRERKNDYISVCDEVIELSKENNWFFDEGRYYFIDISTDYDNHQAYFISYEYKTPYTNYPEYRLSDEIARNCKKSMILFRLSMAMNLILYVIGKTGFLFIVKTDVMLLYIQSMTRGQIFGFFHLKKMI